VVLDGALEAGNKVLVNVGSVNFYGIQRTQNARLRLPVQVGQINDIMVDAGLDWVAGDELYFAPTTIQMHHSDYRIIESYSSSTGLLTLTRGLDHYHYGASKSTAGQYNGADIRCEVKLLTRNVKIAGDDTDGWGGTILTTTMLEVDALQTRVGHIVMDSVQVYNCSQRDTYKAAVRFDLAYTAETRRNFIRNSAIHNGLGWGLAVKDSSHVTVENTAFIGFRAVGIMIHSSKMLNFDGVFVADVPEREVVAIDKFVDKRSGWAVCSYFGESGCDDISIINSAAVGTVWAGFMMYGHECGESST